MYTGPQGWGSSRRKLFLPGQLKKTWENPSCFQFLPEKMGRAGRNVDCTLKVKVTMEICWNGFASFLEELFPEFFYVKDGRLQFM